MVVEASGATSFAVLEGGDDCSPARRPSSEPCATRDARSDPRQHDASTHSIRVVIAGDLRSPTVDVDAVIVYLTQVSLVELALSSQSDAPNVVCAQPSAPAVPK